MSVFVLACASVLACAGTQGWTLDAERTCERDAPPRACVADERDHGHVVSLGDVELLPGECASAAAASQPGALRVTTRDPKGGSRSRWITLRRGRVHALTVDVEGRVDVERRLCTATP